MFLVFLQRFLLRSDPRFVLRTTLPFVSPFVPPTPGILSKSFSLFCLRSFSRFCFGLPLSRCSVGGEQCLRPPVSNSVALPAASRDPTTTPPCDLQLIRGLALFTMASSATCQSHPLSPLKTTPDSTPHFVPVDDNKHICCKCDQEGESEGSITCDKCSRFYHFYCTDLPIYELVKYTKRQFNRKFTCGVCMESLYSNDIKKITQLTSQHTPNTHIKDHETEIQQYKKHAEQQRLDILYLKEEIRRRQEVMKRMEEELGEARDQVHGKTEGQEHDEDTDGQDRESQEEAEVRESEEEVESGEEEEDDDEGEEERLPKITEVLEMINKMDSKLQNLIEQKNKEYNQIQETIRKHDTIKKIDERLQRLEENHENTAHPIPQYQYYTQTRQPNRNRNFTCYNCGRPGHYARQCYRRPQHGRPAFPRNNPRYNYSHQTRRTQENGYRPNTSYSQATYRYPYQQTAAYEAEIERFSIPTTTHSNFPPSQPQRQQKITHTYETQNHFKHPQSYESQQNQQHNPALTHVQPFRF